MSRIQDGFYAFDNDLNSVLAALEGTFVESGGAVTEHGTPQMKVVMAVVVYYINGARVSKAETEVVITAADGSQPRKDIIVGDASGTITAVAGTKAVAKPSGSTGPQTYDPKPADIPANRVLLAEVWVEAAETTILDADITDRRVMSPFLGSRVFISASACGPTYGSPSEGLVGDFSSWLLDDSVLECVSCQFISPFEGDAIVTTVWAMESATSGDVRVGVSLADAALDGGYLIGDITTQYFTVTVPGSAKYTKSTVFFQATSTTLSRANLSTMRFARDGSQAGDTAAGDLHFLGCIISRKA